MIETDRLRLRSFKMSDLEALCILFADQEVMRSSISGTKTPEEVGLWLVKQIEGRPSGDRIELLAVISKSIDKIVGYCGLNKFLNTNGATDIEIAYRFVRMYWGNGYATEAARAVRDYAFNELKINKLFALIEPINKRSIAVAIKIGMSYEKEIMLANYDHPDYLYSMRRTDKYA